MLIRFAKEKDISKLAKFDDHIPQERLEECVRNDQVCVLEDSGFIAGCLRYSFFWQTIPFVDLIYFYKNYRYRGYGSQMMRYWEEDMRESGYKYVMTSTQSNETAHLFYEKLGYKKVGSFLPPDQNCEEWIYLKELN